MKRKLIQIAGKTMVISLPSEFVKKYNLKKSEEVEVLERGNEIQIRTENAIGSSIRIEITDIEFLGERIDIFYSCGVDRIQIKITNSDSVRKIQDALEKNKVDYEIFFPSDKTCVLEAIKTVDVEHFENLVRRIFMILGQDEIHRPTLLNLLSLCTRILHKKGYQNHSTTIIMSNMLSTMRQIVLAGIKPEILRGLYGLYCRFDKPGLEAFKKGIPEIKNLTNRNLLTQMAEIIVSLEIIGTKKEVLY